MKILVLGGNGQVGKAISKISIQYPEIRIIAATRDDLDLTDPTTSKKIISIRPDVVVNCAAYTAVDLAEKEIKAAYDINVRALSFIIDGCQKLDIPLIHISSDYVYHIEKNGPLVESDRCRPKGEYAKSKLQGDEIALTYDKIVIIRTSWVYSNFGKNFFNTMLSLKDKKELTIVEDQIGSPTYAIDLAHALLQIAQKITQNDFNQSNYGIYHFSNEGITTWFDFAQAIFELSGYEMTLHKTTTKEYNAPAPRPLWSVLSKQKIKTVFGIQVQHWRDALLQCIAEKDAGL